MFEAISERLSRTLGNLRRGARLSEDNIAEALREVRRALLEADVALPVAREFLDRVRERAVGQEVLRSLTPDQALVGVVHEELVRLMAAEHADLVLNVPPPAPLLVAGLQGSGKTTTCAKLARWLVERHGRKALLASCDVYRPAAIEHVPVETQVCLAVPEPDGRLTIYSCTQALYFTMGVVAAHLQVPLNKLKVIGGTVGGGFGGKVDTASDTVTALAAIKAGRPVKWRWTREEEFLASSTRAPWHMEIIDAVTNDGWILGRKMLTLHDSGAYARFSPYGVTKHSFHHTGAYTIPNLYFDGYVVFTNRVPTTAMRGFGVTSISFAVETHMSRVAEELGMDPYEIRLLNANRINDTSPNRIRYTDPSTVDVLHSLANAKGVELTPAYAGMTRDPRSGDLLPDHLVGQMKTEGH
jgi:CO/xanthine dehydrogenase Mo-binding subunit